MPTVNRIEEFKQRMRREAEKPTKTNRCPVCARVKSLSPDGVYHWRYKCPFLKKWVKDTEDTTACKGFLDFTAKEKKLKHDQV